MHKKAMLVYPYFSIPWDSYIIRNQTGIKLFLFSEIVWLLPNFYEYVDSLIFKSS